MDLIINFTAPGSPPADGYEVKYRKVGTFTWFFQTGASSPITIVGVDAGADYEGTIRSICVTGSVYSSEVSWTAVAPTLPPGGKNVFVVNETGAAISITTDVATYNFAAGVNGNIVVQGAGFLTNASAAGHSFRFLTSMPSTDDALETPNPDVLAAAATHTLNASVTGLNYIRVS